MFFLFNPVLLLWGFFFSVVETRAKVHRSSEHRVSRHDTSGSVLYQEGRTSVVYTLSGNDHNAPCVFPFYYDGKNYTSCTYKDCKHNLPWCATTNNYDRDKKWGHCQTDKDVTDCIDLHSRCGTWAMDGECVVNAPYMCKKCPRSCGLCTHGGNGRGKPCKFPFFFKNRLVYNCLRFNKKTWCATTTDYNKDKRWGYCFPKLYRDIREVNEKFFHWGECDDLNDDCRQWAKQGLCQKDPEEMHEMCPWSCHKCAPMKLVTLKGCQDYSSSCAEWARRGDCEDNTVFMFAFCRWSCKQCAKSTIAKTARDRMPRGCRSWVRNGDCYLHQEFMLQNCRESCMAGGYKNGRMCLDEVADCHNLAREGLCKSRSAMGIMRQYCKYSCGWCS